MSSVSLGYSLLGMVLLFFSILWFGGAKFAGPERRYCICSSLYTLCWSMASVMISLRGVVHNWVGYNLANILLCAGFMFLVLSTSAYFDRVVSRPLLLVVLLVSSLAIAVTGSEYDQQFSRLSILGIASLFYISIALFIATGPLFREFGYAIAIAVIVVGLFAISLWVMRLGWGAYMSPSDLSLVNPTAFNFYAIYLIWVLALSFQGLEFFMLINRVGKRLERRSFIDPLTEISNRLGLKDFWNSLSEDKLSIAILMLDIDHFKKVNDTYGHDVGDEVIRAVVGRVENSIRNQDHLARYGGEEFIVVLPGYSDHEAVAVAERIRERIERQPVNITHRELRVSVSIGVGAGCRSGNMERIIQKADKALYQAKASGRNRVQLAGM